MGAKSNVGFADGSSPTEMLVALALVLIHFLSVALFPMPSVFLLLGSSSYQWTGLYVIAWPQKTVLVLGQPGHSWLGLGWPEIEVVRFFSWNY